jgi:hypothetical protein
MDNKYLPELAKAIANAIRALDEYKEKRTEVDLAATRVLQLQKLQDNNQLADSATKVEMLSYLDSFLTRDNSIKMEIKKTKEIISDIQVKLQECIKALNDAMSIIRYTLKNVDIEADTAEAISIILSQLQIVVIEVGTAEADMAKAATAEADMAEAVTT